MRPTRRDILDLSLRAAAMPAAAEFLAQFAQAQTHNHSGSSSAPPEPPFFRDYKPKFFSPEDFSALESFTEILIPTDETPGAKEAHCAHYIDFVLSASENVPDTQKRWRDAMAMLKEEGFHQADTRKRESIVAEISRPERERGATHPAFPAYLLIKQQNTFAFYTSRAGLIENLDYRGNSFNESFPACNHPEHHRLG